MSTKNEAMSEDKSAAVFKSIQSHCDAIFKMLVLSLILAAANLTLSLVLLFMVLDLVCSLDRSGTPLAPPPSATAQVPARTEAVPPTDVAPDREDQAIAAPGGTAVTADPTADQTTH